MRKNIFFTITFSLFFILLITANHVYAADCANVPLGGNYTVSADCIFSGTVNGVDNGNLTIAAGKTLTISSTQTIAYTTLTITKGSPGGSIAINKGGTAKLQKTNLWMVDADADNYPANTTQYTTDTKIGNTRQRSNMTTITNVDCDDTTNTKYQNLTCYLDSDGDGYTVAGGTSVCKAATCASPADSYKALSSPTDGNDSVACTTGYAEYAGTCTAICKGCSNGACVNIPTGTQDLLGSTLCNTLHYACSATQTCTNPTTQICNNYNAPTCANGCGAATSYCISGYFGYQNCTFQPSSCTATSYENVQSCLCAAYVY